jgi:hypothetical protein
MLDALFPTLDGAVIGAHEEYQHRLRQMAEAQEYETQNRGYEYEFDHYEPDDDEPPYDESQGRMARGRKSRLLTTSASDPVLVNHTRRGLLAPIRMLSRKAPRRFCAVVFPLL